MEHSVIVHTQHDREGFAGVESEGTLRTRDSAVMSVGRKAETSRCSRKRLKRTHFWLPHPKKIRFPLPVLPESPGIDGPTGGGAEYTDPSPGRHNGNPDVPHKIQVLGKCLPLTVLRPFRKGGLLWHQNV